MRHGLALDQSEFSKHLLGAWSALQNVRCREGCGQRRLVKPRAVSCQLNWVPAAGWLGGRRAPSPGRWGGPSPGRKGFWRWVCLGRWGSTARRSGIHQRLRYTMSQISSGETNVRAVSIIFLECLASNAMQYLSNYDFAFKRCWWKYKSKNCQFRKIISC